MSQVNDKLKEREIAVEDVAAIIATKSSVIQCGRDAIIVARSAIIFVRWISEGWDYRRGATHKYSRDRDQAYLSNQNTSKQAVDSL